MRACPIAPLGVTGHAELLNSRLDCGLWPAGSSDEHDSRSCLSIQRVGLVSVDDFWDDFWLEQTGWNKDNHDY
jgi:hypothetical protein